MLRARPLTTLICAVFVFLVIGSWNEVQAADERSYNATVGPGTYTAPAFPGARDSHTVLFPFVDAEYHNRWYTSASDIVGYYGLKRTNAEFGAALEWDLTQRRSRDDERLSGWRDVKETARVKIFANRTIAFITADANIATDVLGHGQGTLALANLWITIPFSPSVSLSIGPGITWADREYMTTFYAVTAAQASRSSLAMFTAHAGISDAHINGFLQWNIASHYQLGISTVRARLTGDAGESPITQTRRQFTAMGWLAYRF